MTRNLQHRRGTTAANDNFTGAIGEVTMDTTNNTLRVHDGQTVGGTALAKQDEIPEPYVMPENYDFEKYKKLVPMQAGDVPITYADTSALERDFGFKPSTPLRDGIRNFARWYKDFYVK